MQMINSCGLLAQSASTFTQLEWNWPTDPLQAFLFWSGIFVAIVYVIWLYQKDSRDLSLPWRIWLVFWRVVVFTILIVIMGNPQERTQKMSYRPSRVIFMVDTSTSMQNPLETPGSDTNQSAITNQETRAEAIQKMLGESPLLEDLQQKHDVLVYTFDRNVEGPYLLLPSQDPRSLSYKESLEQKASAPQPETTDSSATKNPAPAEKGNTKVPELVKAVDWKQVLLPRGVETRLGDALTEILTRENSKTLSGIVVVSDGVSNAGLNAEEVNILARQSKTRLFTVGLGGLKNPTNLEVTRVLAPSNVQVGDAFDIRAFVQGQSLINKPVTVQLQSVSVDDKNAEPVILEERVINLLEDGVPIEVVFEQKPTAPGERVYSIKAIPPKNTIEMRDTDNAADVTITATDQPLKILLFAGGPSRDYSFLRSVLYRSSGIEMDIFLQTGEIGISQEAKNIIYEFPPSRNELFKYDVIVCFDPNWNAVTLEQKQQLLEWVKTQGGGLVFVAGDIFTSMLSNELQDDNQAIRTLLPIFLGDNFYDSRNDKDSGDPWPIELTPDGKDSSFMQIAEDPANSQLAWNEFPGIYRCYPSAGPKSTAMVYAFHKDQRRINEFGAPIFLAGQYLGQGKTFYIGSPEVYRLNGFDREYFQRFWTKLIRHTGQGRLQRGNQRGLFLLESPQIVLSQSFNVKVRLSDAEYKPLKLDKVNCEVVLPNGKSVIPPLTLLPDPRREGDYLAAYRGTMPGRLRLKMQIPDTEETIEQFVDVTLPRLEEQEYRQNVKLLNEITQDTGGTYLTLAEAVRLPELLPNQGEEFILAERLRALWDQQWVMYLLVTALGIEWLSRKLLRMA